MELSGNLQTRPRPQHEPLNVLFLGTAGSGKSSIMNRIIYNQLLPPNSFYDPTPEELSRKYVTVDSERYIVDTAKLDSEHYLSVHKPHIRYADRIILMYSICSPKSFSALESLWTSVKLQKVREKKGLYVDIVGNMSDLWEKRSVKTEDGKALAQILNCGFSECSQKRGRIVKR